MSPMTIPIVHIMRFIPTGLDISHITLKIINTHQRIPLMTYRGLIFNFQLANDKTISIKNVVIGKVIIANAMKLSAKKSSVKKSSAEKYEILNIIFPPVLSPYGYYFG